MLDILKEHKELYKVSAFQLQIEALVWRTVWLCAHCRAATK